MPRTRTRPSPRDLQRVLLGYLVTALALGCGLPVLIAGVIGANRCHSEGFRCLGYFVYGLLAAGIVAAVALPLLARRFGLGVWFGLLAIAMVVAPLVLAGGSVLGGTAFLGPGLAAWISEPVRPDQERPDPLRFWGPRLGAALLCAIVLPLLGRVV